MAIQALLVRYKIKTLSVLYFNSATILVNHEYVSLTFSGELVEDLKSCDVEVQQKAMERADRYVAALDEPCITKVNKTRINTEPSLQASSVKSCTQSHQSHSIHLHLLTLYVCESLSLPHAHTRARTRTVRTGTFLCCPLCHFLLCKTGQCTVHCLASSD